MRDNHIIRMLEERSASDLGESEIAYIESHAAHCPECLRAYEAARISATLIRARASEAVAPSPFFKTRVMAALKEKQLSPELPALVRMWKAAGSLVFSMAAMVVVLAGLTFFSYGPDLQIDPQEITDNQSIYSPEYVVLERDDLSDETLPYDELLSTMYETGDANEQ